ncbi:MAG TPA: hypothetical protein VFY10_13900 [Dehalococcoidia bacterium]|nr:hypothetical protein [Dehalococcoidia bacterium]
MATVQVIMHGMPGGTMHDTDEYPLILQFDEDRDYGSAVWIIPSYPGEIPAGMLSEIRITGGPVTCFVEGPEGFHSGPHRTDWVRCEYPRGKFCSFLQMDPDHKKLGGVSVEIVEGSLVVDPVNIGGGSSASSSGTPAEGAAKAQETTSTAEDAGSLTNEP